MSVIIELKSKYEAKNAGGLIRTLAAGDKPGVTEIVLDIRNMNFYEPLPLCIILATVTRWRDLENKNIEIKYYSNTQGSSYAERMDFFKHLGIEINSTRQRHDPNDNFITIRKIDRNTKEEILAREISTCLVKDMDLHQATQTMYLLEYLMGELIKNCQQHSGALGFLHAQYFRSDGMFYIGIADFGMGIPESYRVNGSPRYKAGATDVHMLSEALEVESSSTTHKRTPQGQDSPNYGVGLPMCRALTRDALGVFNIYSRDAFVYDDFGKADAEPMAARKLGATYQGVCAGLGFVRSAVGQVTFLQILEDVKIKLGLQNAKKGPSLPGAFQ